MQHVHDHGRGAHDPQPRTITADRLWQDGHEPVHPQILLEVDLRDGVRGGVRFDQDTRAKYSSDPQDYRYGPRGVVYPFAPDDAAAAIDVCRRHDVPVVSRTAGDGLPCVGAVVLDWTKYCCRVISIDPDNHTAIVEPGIALAEFNRRLAEHQLMIAPPGPGSAVRDVGGLIADNALLNSIRWLEILTYDGTRAWVGETSDSRYDEVMDGGGRHAALLHGLRDIRDRYTEDIRDRYTNLHHRPVGYNLDFLLPEHRFNVAKLLAGSDNTLAAVVRAEVMLVPRPDDTEPTETLPVLDRRDRHGLAPDDQAAADFGPRLVTAFGEVKELFDPDHRMGPAHFVTAGARMLT